ncbi:DMT family transporter [Streptomyces chartreusis]
MPWLWLIFAGIVEAAWSQSIKPTAGFTKIPQTVLCMVLMISAVYLLTRAMQDIPVGTSYAVFTGIGTLGAMAMSVAIQGETLTATKTIAMTLILSGLIMAHLSTTAT